MRPASTLHHTGFATIVGIILLSVTSTFLALLMFTTYSPKSFSWIFTIKEDVESKINEEDGVSIPDIVERANPAIGQPFLGVRYLQITESIAETNDLAVDYGILIIRGETNKQLAVIPGSAADKAGLEENDIILEFNGFKLDRQHGFAGFIRQMKVGDTIRLKVLHDGKEKEVDITLEKTP